MRWSRTTTVALSLALAPAVMVAAPEPARAQSAQKTLELRYSGGDSWLTSDRVARAVERELGVKVVTNAAGSEGTLVVAVAAGAGKSPGTVQVTFVDPSGRKVSRSFERPDDDAKAVESVALLAGNLVRNEAAEILADLEKEPSDTERTVVEEREAGGAAGDADAKDIPPPPPPTESGAQPPPPPPPKNDSAKPPPPPEPGEGTSLPEPPAPKGSWRPRGWRKKDLNLSLFHPIALDRNSHKLEVGVELGAVYSRIGQVNALGLNVFVLRVHHDADGFIGASFFSEVEGEMQGFQGSGLVNLAGELDGVQFSGIYGEITGPIEGAQGAGIAVWSDGSLIGVQGAGILARAKGPVEGVQGAGIVSLLEGKLMGVQAAGIVSSAGDVDGLQAAGIVSEADAVEGMQLASVTVNEGLQGFQAGVVNVAGDVEGVQLGLVNVADHVDGVALGLVSIADNGRIQPNIWLSGTDQLHGGMSFEVGPVYTMTAITTQLGGEREDLGFGFYLGGKHRMGALSFAVDGSYSEEYRLGGSGEKVVEVSRARGLVGLEIIEGALTVVGGVGLRLEEDLKVKGPESHLGVAFF